MTATPAPIHQGFFDSRRTVLEVVEDLALLAPLIAGSRFAAYREALRAHLLSGRQLRDLEEPQRVLLHHAFAESLEFLNILAALKAPPMVLTWEVEIRRLLSGEWTARSAKHFVEFSGSANEPGRQRSLEEVVSLPLGELGLGRVEGGAVVPPIEESSRNAAFELGLAVLFRRAGLNPEKTEPDWVVPTTVGRMAVAAKRIQSMHRLAKRTGEAAGQIAKQVRTGSTATGMVAVDLTLALDLHRKHWVIGNEAESPALHRAVVGAIAHQQVRIVKALRRHADVFAVLLHAKALVFVHETQSFLTVRPILLAAMAAKRSPHYAWLAGFASATTAPREDETDVTIA